MTTLHTFRDADAVADAVARAVAEAAVEAVGERGRFLLVLAGGSTPRGVYQRLAAEHARSLPWDRVHLFWGDERAVPPDHPQSNFGMADASLLRHLRLPPAHVHRIAAERPAADAAREYDERLAAFFGTTNPDALTDGHAFDLVLLGIGADAHTASLFPGSAAVSAPGWAAPAVAPATADIRDRITLTFSALNAARDVLFLATGADKREAVRRALAGKESASAVPAGAVHGRRATRWYLDAAATPPASQPAR